MYAAYMQPWTIFCISNALEALQCHRKHQGDDDPWWGRSDGEGEGVSEVPAYGKLRCQ